MPAAVDDRDVARKGRSPVPVGGGVFPVESTVWRCQYCNTPFFVGKLGPGTVIEVLCRRGNCPQPRPRMVQRLVSL